MLSAAKSLCGNVILSEAKYLCVRSCFVHFFLFVASKKKETQPKKEKPQSKRNLEFFTETLKSRCAPQSFDQKILLS